jgi:D-alanyl-D-alanine carboxypeptidase/D-alanyl-D-alanine-endopeptidase (penicillin-binding protein 4)
MIPLPPEFLCRNPWRYVVLLFVMAPSLACGGANDLDSIFNAGYAAESWSCVVADRQGRLVYGLNQDQPMIPASNQKLFTIAAALIKLGPKYQSATRVRAAGGIVDGLLDGNLVFEAAGAVHFTSRYPAAATAADKNARLNRQLDAFADALKQKGIIRIRGRLIADASAWTDMSDNAHYPCAGPLSFNENTIDIDASAGEVQTVPRTLGGFSLIRAASGSTQTKLRFDGKRSDIIRVNTTRESRDYWRLDAMAAEQHYLTQLRAALTSRGIAVDGRHIRAVGGEKIVDLASIPMAELLRETGRHSDNFRAEIAALTLGFETNGVANYQTGPAAVASVLRDAGMTLGGYQAADGSGLSRDNRASAANVVELLLAMRRSRHVVAFRDSLARPGEPGTLATRLPAFKGRVMAKTGTHTRVKALSGYLSTDDGELVFAFICNDAKDSKMMWQVFEKALGALAE